jgi:hypothetical protein
MKTQGELQAIQAERDRYAVQELLASTEKGKQNIRESTDTIMSRLYGVEFANGRVKGLVSFNGDYNSKAGISTALGSYADLKKMLDARHDAYYKRKERLDEFVVLGKMRLDTCGNAMMLIRQFERGVYDASWADGHPVLTMNEAFVMMRQAGHEDGMCSTSKCLPTPTVRCDCCGRGWDLTNFTDFVSNQKGQLVPCDPEWMGKTLAEFQAHVKERSDAIYFSCESPLRNDKYIDLRPDPNYPTLKINERGFLREKFKGHDGTIHGDVDSKTHVIEAGDEAYFQMLVFRHNECHMKQLRDEVRADFEKSFKDAGLNILSQIEVPNEYGSLSYNGPWYIFTTDIGSFKVGWRKRVIELNWDHTNSGINYLHLFDDVQDTKDHYSIHAWNYEKLGEYLKRIKESQKLVKV